LYLGMKQSPTYLPFRINASIVLKDMGKNREALEMARKAYDIAPLDFDANYHLADALRLNGMTGDAIKKAEAAAGYAQDAGRRDAALKLLAGLGAPHAIR
ncbi:MAG TPA: hypothetical protein VGK71_06275, partial [Nitrospirota bacterium]